MIRLLLPLVAAAAALALGSVATASTVEIPSAALHPILSNPSGPSAPVLTLTASKPLVVRGTRFAHSEHVRVTFSAGRDVLVRTVETTPTGAFSLTAPPALAYDPCTTGLVIVAKGTNGDRGVIRRLPRGCAPA